MDVPGMGRVRRHPVVAYFLIAYAVSWSVWIPMALTGRLVRQGDGWPTHTPGLMGPLVAAIVVTALTEGRSGVRDLFARIVRWRVRVRWYVVAFSTAVAFAFTYALLDILGLDVPALSDLGRFSGFPAIGVLGVWILLVLVNSLGEEAGWRGYALPELQKKRSPLVASVIIGALWALWHVPSFFVIENYRTLGATMYPGFVLGILAGSILLTWLYNGSGGSILLVSLWHGTYNLVGGSAAAKGTIAAVISTFVMVCAILLVIFDRRLGRTEGRASPKEPPAAQRAA